MDSRRRYNREKFCGLPVLKTCYVFAIINLVLVGLCVLACVVAEGYLVARFFIAAQNLSQSTIWFVFIYAVACIVTATYGIFAVLLLQGLRLNKPGLVLGYLLFGLILETLLIMSSAIYTAITANLRNCEPNCANYNGGMALCIVICVFYGFILGLVRRTYLVVSRRSNQNNVINEQTMLYICESA